MRENGLKLFGSLGVMVGQVFAHEQLQAVLGWRVRAHGVDQMIEGRELRGMLHLVNLVEADRLEDTGEDTQRLNGGGAGQLAEGDISMRDLREAHCFEAKVFDPEAAVHVVDIIDALRRPQALGYGSGAGPDARVDGKRPDVFTPHADLAAEDMGPLVRG